ncbi:AraC family transcriptional regulator [Vibrio aestuarianus]|uniref:Helix-turn-helix domain-containing protein n=2 Tax=Vibrio TaxID=662 RepID=A0A9X4FGV8_9VIBR|nr:helix-turn-helix domain-containing protein [Vibrio aestuarianus]MDE1236628.1 helix-turn-helix domain-containing protein [Vibrio aestuarianus]MDE1247519.1 helix-turn-helix domain-containing protein [Vibrio aestuarianus]MDE1347946.1 helix-turn-helix domain-containing protein [Vibrio aestuarianus]NGZ64737.1 AraC family transcriptional regulator [Vibrio aestuarianus subsp. cardii]
MLHWLLSPKAPTVAKYVQCYWLIEKQPNAESYPFPKLNPDPCAHLIISPKNQRYRYDFNSAASIGLGSHWLYPHQQTVALDHTNPFVHLGIKFHTGVLYSLPQFSKQVALLEQSMLLDQVEEVASGDRLYNLLDLDELITLAQSDPNNCVDQLDTKLTPWLKLCSEDKHSELTRQALKHLDNTPISDLGERLFCSQRTLERSFQRVTGMTLKQCQSMNRLEVMLEYIYQRDSDALDWVDIAFRFGFSDQPHLIRYLKKQLGLTPKTYEKERGLTIDVYGGITASND